LSLGKTQEEVARAMGIAQSDYSKLERRRDVRVSTLRSAADALGGSLHLAIRLPGRVVEVVIGGES
jgi:transcriptional regulator with XRE-family HTH domain